MDQVLGAEVFAGAETRTQLDAVELVLRSIAEICTREGSAPGARWAGSVPAGGISIYVVKVVSAAGSENVLQLFDIKVLHAESE